MAEFERTRTVDAPPDALFAYLSDVANLPLYFRGITEARRGPGPDEIEVAAVVKDREVRGVAHLEVDDDARRMEWSSEGPNDYRGWLAVRPKGDASEVELHISTVRVESGEVDEGIDRSLDVIARIMASRHGLPVGGAG
jgi:hypothetical protein